MSVSIGLSSNNAGNGVNVELAQKQEQIQNFAKKYKIEIADNELSDPKLVDVIVRFIALNEYKSEQPSEVQKQPDNQNKQRTRGKISNFFRKFQHESVFSNAFNKALSNAKTGLNERTVDEASKALYSNFLKNIYTIDKNISMQWDAIFKNPKDNKKILGTNINTILKDRSFTRLLINSIIENSNTSSLDNSLINATLDSCFNKKMSNEEKIKQIQFLVFTINHNKNKLPLFPIIHGHDGNFTADQEEIIKTRKICDKTFNDIVSDENLCYLLITNLLNRNLEGTNADDDMYAKCKIFANILAKDKNLLQKTSDTETEDVKGIKCIKDFIQILCGNAANNDQFFFQSKKIDDIVTSPTLIYLLINHTKSTSEVNDLIQEFNDQNKGIVQWKEVTYKARANESLGEYKFFGKKIENIFNSPEMSLCLIAAIMETKNCTASLDDMLKINNELQNKNHDVRNKIIVLDEKTNFLLKKEKGNIVYTTKIEDNIIKLTVPNRVENLVFSGGGGKGLGYSQSINTLIKADVLDNVKNVAGSSAGALAATAVAIGLKGEALSNFVTNVLNGTQTEYENIENYYSKGHGIFDLIKLDSKPSKLISVIPTIISTVYTTITSKLIPNTLSGFFSKMVVDITINKLILCLKEKYENFSNSLGIVQYIDTQTRETVSKFLNSLGKDQAYSNLTEAEKERLNFLQDTNRHKDENGKVIEGAMITFNDLTILSKVNTNPKKNPFKKLVITGWDNNHGKELYFNSENTPNMPVAYAARASMALPMAFCATQLNFGRYGGKYQDKGILTVKDGGLGSNIPVEIFINELAPRDGEDAKEQEKRLEKNASKT